MVQQIPEKRSAEFEAILRIYLFNFFKVKTKIYQEIRNSLKCQEHNVHTLI